MLFVPEINSGGSRNDNVILSRRKRYVAFPDGSTLIVSFFSLFFSPQNCSIFSGRFA